MKQFPESSDKLVDKNLLRIYTVVFCWQIVR